MASPPRVVVLQTHPIQYYAPLYRALAEQNLVELEVVYLSDGGSTGQLEPGFGRSVVWDIPLREGYESRVLRPALTLTEMHPWQIDADGLLGHLSALEPDALLVFGYACRMNWRAAAWAKARGIPVVYFSDSSARLRSPGWSRVFKVPAVRAFFALVSVFCAPSEANEQYLTSFGVSPSRIVRVPFAIDAQRFATAAELRPLADVCWAGKMLPAKRGLDLILALRQLHGDGLALTAAMIGSGPELEMLKAEAAALPAGAVLFPGFKNQAEMPAALRSGKIFCFTSGSDPYGLVVTEAAAVGCAIVAADINGCVGAGSSADPNRNALIYPAGDVPSLATCIRRLHEDRDLYVRLSAESRAIAASHDVRVAARTFAAAFVDAVESSGRRTG